MPYLGVLKCNTSSYDHPNHTPCIGASMKIQQITQKHKSSGYPKQVETKLKVALKYRLCVIVHIHILICCSGNIKRTNTFLFLFLSLVSSLPSSSFIFYLYPPSIHLWSPSLPGGFSLLPLPPPSSSSSLSSP